MNGTYDLPYLLWMAETAELSPLKCGALLERYGSGEAVYQAETKELEQVCRLDERDVQHLNNRSLAPANRILAQCSSQNIQILTLLDAAYPDRLKNIYDPPLLLYVRGRLPDFDRLPAVAVVGQRRATPYGLLAAERMGFFLSEGGAIVVSGMAAGIDSAAHRGALKAATPTVAVFGTAIDGCFPAANAGLLRQILSRGAAISEYPPGKHTYPSAFPRRNRIISGLCLGVVVAEAPRKSGSLITAGLALDQGRDVFAVPGGIDAESSEGCNELIARGAKLVRGAEDVLCEYRGQYPIRDFAGTVFPSAGEEKRALPQPVVRRAMAPAAAPPVPRRGGTEKTIAAVFSPPAAEKEQDPVLRAIDGIVHLDEICARTGLPVQQLLSQLTLLELRGKLRQLPGNYYQRI